MQSFLFLCIIFYIYIIFSKQANRFYVGYSENPRQRIEQHNSNKIEKYTGKFKDWNLCAVFEVSESRAEALRIEKFIKRQKSRNLILKMIDPQTVLSGELSKLVRVPHVRD